MSQTPHIDSDVLSAYLDGAVSAAERAMVDGHLAGCGRCRRELAELRAVVEGLRGLPQYRPRRSFGVQPAAPPRGTLPVRLLPVVRPLAVAAIVLFVVVTGVAYVEDDSTSELAPTVAQATQMEEAPPESAAREGTTEDAAASLNQEATTAGDESAGLEEQEAAAPQSAGEADQALAPMADAAPTMDAAPTGTTAAGDAAAVEAARTGEERRAVADEPIDGWALASAALGMAAAGLLVAWAALARMSGRPRGGRQRGRA